MRMDMNGPVDGLRTIVYVGKSMYPLLRDLDILYFTPYDGQRLKVGDVIIFKPAGSSGDASTTHRIISLNENGVITIGDNNRAADSGVVSPRDILGFVVYAKRKDRLVRVHSGFQGRLLFITIRLLLALRNFGVNLLVWPYHVLSGSGIFRPFVPSSMKPRVVSFKRNDVIERRLLMGNRVVGRRNPRNNKWTIYPPYKLFINEALLSDKAIIASPE